MKCVCGEIIKYIPPFGYVHQKDKSRFIYICKQCGYREGFLHHYYRSVCPKCKKSSFILEHIVHTK